MELISAPRMHTAMIRLDRQTDSCHGIGEMITWCTQDEATMLAHTVTHLYAMHLLYWNTIATLCIVSECGLG